VFKLGKKKPLGVRVGPKTLELNSRAAENFSTKHVLICGGQER
jgi:hypothetical protein